MTCKLFQIDPIDDTAVKKMILKFEKRASKNQEMRIKFPDNPEKYDYFIFCLRKHNSMQKLKVNIAFLVFKFFLVIQ